MPKEPRPKLLPLYLEPDVYRRLDEQARQQDREATQQARHLIKLALDGGRTEPDR